MQFMIPLKKGTLNIFLESKIITRWGDKHKKENEKLVQFF